MGRLKWGFIIILGLALLAIGGYLGYDSFATRKQAAFACVATSFPYVIMEHRRAELSGFLDNIDLDEDQDPDEDAVNKAIEEAGKGPKKYFLSEAIDKKMLELAESIQNRPEEAPPLTGADMSQFLTELEPLFKAQAPAYMKDCQTLFATIIKTCGSFDDNSEESQGCRDKFDPEVNALLQNHLVAKENGETEPQD